MSEVHYVKVKAEREGKMGQLPCTFQGTETFFFESDSEALLFCGGIAASGFKIESTGCYRTGSVAANMASLQVFYEGLEDCVKPERFLAKRV